MAYNAHIAAVYNQIKTLPEGRSINMAKTTANRHGYFSCEDLADWASSINNKVVVKFEAQNARFVISVAPDKLGRLRKVIKHAKFNYSYATICTPEEVRAAFEESGMGGELKVWTGLATYFIIAK